jgi:hypothetical protein
MKRQMTLGFSDGVRAQEAVSEAHQAVFDLVDGIQAKAAAIALEIDEATLSKKRTRRDRNRLAWDEAVKLLVIGKRDDAKRVLSILLRYLDCKPAEDAPPPEDLAAYIERLHSELDDVLAPAAKEKVLRKARGL